MLKLAMKKIFYISVRRDDKSKEFDMNISTEEQSFNFISQQTSEQSKGNSAESPETAGSLAMNSTSAPLFAAPVYNYDMFIPTNPFSLNIDFSSYSAEGQENLANNNSFLQGFTNAMNAINGGTLGTSAGSAGSATVASAAGCGGGSCSCGGGFTSIG